MLSKSCTYALRSIIFIAKNSTKDSKIGIKEIANNLDLPTHYLGKILQQLVKHNIVLSVKGPNGGFYINNKSTSTPLLKIVEVVDGVSLFNNCCLGLDKCSTKHPCPMHDEFKPHRDGLKKMFKKNTIHDLVHKLESGNTYIRSIIN